MRFRLVKTGKSYADDADTEEALAIDENVINTRGNKSSVPPIIWETGNSEQIRSLLVLREAELVVAKTHLTAYHDFYVSNKILDLERKINDLKRWLAEAADL